MRELYEEDEKQVRKLRLQIVGGVLLILLLAGLLIFQDKRTQKKVQEGAAPTEAAVPSRQPGMPQEGTTPAGNTAGESTEGNAEGERYPRIRKSADGREYTPYATAAKWELLSEDEKAALTAELIPVLQDENKTIDQICQRRSNPELEPYSFVLAPFLRTYCREHNIKASEGEFLVYGEWISKTKESFYLQLNDPDKSILLAVAEDYGRYWSFERVSKSREEIFKAAGGRGEIVSDTPTPTAAPTPEPPETPIAPPTEVPTAPPAEVPVA